MRPGRNTCIGGPASPLSDSAHAREPSPTVSPRAPTPPERAAGLLGRRRQAQGGTGRLDRGGLDPVHGHPRELDGAVRHPAERHHRPNLRGQRCPWSQQQDDHPPPPIDHPPEEVEESEIREIVEELDRTPAFYFDSITQ